MIFIQTILLKNLLFSRKDKKTFESSKITIFEKNFRNRKHGIIKFLER